MHPRPKEETTSPSLPRLRRFINHSFRWKPCRPSLHNRPQTVMILIHLHQEFIANPCNV
jgi:hypothetical protein